MDSPSDLEPRGLFEARYLAFLETITHLRPSLHRYCARMTGSVFDGEDVVQTALFQAYRKLDSLADDRPLAPWLFRIAHNCCIDFLRHQTVQQHAEGVPAAYAKGELPARTGVGFAYMWSADQQLGAEGHWHPHMMIYAPHYDNTMLGGNAPPLPFVADDAGAPFAVVVIALDDKLAIKALPR